MQKRYPRWGVAVFAGLIVLAIGLSWAADNSPAMGSGLNNYQAIVLGIVEGLTEYLPVSSTGHLLVAKEMMGLGDDPASDAAINAYIVVIQFGAILAILVICLNRFVSLYQGIFKGDAAGRKLLANLIFAFLPAVVVGLALEDQIKSRLFGTYPVIIGWVVGGLVILGFAFLCRHRSIDIHQGRRIEDISIPVSLFIGFAQCLAMWPGVSRSLATILGALFMGVSMTAAVEFSFLLGAVTLSAASFYDLLKHGREMIHVFDFFPMALGLVFAFVSAMLSVKWMVGYLNRYGLELFGYYRIAIAMLAWWVFFF
ncbi:MAG: undecaprenyl-diphosphate phosphatase [Thermodesulfobacteriota bacterium]